MASLATFRNDFPEFKGAGDAFVQAFIDKAARRVKVAVFGDLTDDAIYYLAAHLMAVSPFGNSAKLSGVDMKKRGYERSTYGLEYKTYALAKSPGRARVT